MGTEYTELFIERARQDTSGETVVGANIKIKGADIGTITDLDGNFSLLVPAKGQY